MSSVDRLATVLQELGDAEHTNLRDLIEAALTLGMEDFRCARIGPRTWRLVEVDDPSAASGGREAT